MKLWLWVWRRTRSRSEDAISRRYIPRSLFSCSQNSRRAARRRVCREPGLLAPLQRPNAGRPPGRGGRSNLDLAAVAADEVAEARRQSFSLRPIAIKRHKRPELTSSGTLWIGWRTSKPFAANQPSGKRLADFTASPAAPYSAQHDNLRGSFVREIAAIFNASAIVG